MTKLRFYKGFIEIDLFLVCLALGLWLVFLWVNLNYLFFLKPILNSLNNLFILG
jgi:hypothetical protein